MAAQGPKQRPTSPHAPTRGDLGKGLLRGPGPRDALKGQGPPRQPHKRLDRRLEEVAEAVGGRLLSVTSAIEAGTWRQGDSGWA